MTYELPEKFAKQTRWVHLKGGVEFGPFGARDILVMMRNGEIDADTPVVELESRKSCRLAEVAPFNAYLDVLSKDRQKAAADQEYEQHKARLGRGRKMLVPAIAVAVPLILAGAYIFLFRPDLLATGSKGPKVVIEEGAATGSSEAPAVEEAPEQITEEMAIAEPESEEEKHRKAAEAMAARHAAETMARSGSVEDLSGLGQKVERTAAPEARIAPTGGNSGHAAEGRSERTGAGKAEEGVVVMDFSEDDDEEESSPELARERLERALKSCTRKTAIHYGDIEEYHTTASATLTPSGSMERLKMEVEPMRHVADLKTCVSGQLLAIQVPSFDGSPKEIHVSAHLKFSVQ